METTTQTHDEALREMGFEIQVSLPSGGVDDKNWPHIAYAVMLTIHGKAAWSGPYKLGVGYVKIPTFRQGLPHPIFFTKDESYLWNTLRDKPLANIADKALHASFCAKLAIAQKVMPELADVLHSLMLNASPAFTGETFQDWCSNFDYSDDSIKAKAMYDTCVQTGLALRRALSWGQIEKIQDILQDY